MNIKISGPIVTEAVNLVCPACGTLSSAADRFEVSAFQDCSFAGFSYQKCKKCSSIFLANALTDDELTDLHVKFWGIGENFKFQFAPEKTPKLRKEEWLELYAPILSTFENGKHGERRRTLLDVGSGTGAFCGAAAELGFDTYGLEPNRSSFNQADACFPECTFLHGSIAELFDKKLDNVPIAFDIITLHDVLEHIVNPSRLISELGKRLSPGGRIYLRVPSGEHLQFDCLKQYSWALMAPFHRTLFTRNGLEIMLREVNFDVFRYLPPGYVWGWTRGLSWKLGIEKEYCEMRKNADFVKLDYAIDTMLEEISKMMNREPSIFCEIGISE